LPNKPISKDYGWRYIQKMNIKEFHEVKFSDSGRVGIEATLMDGNKALVYTTREGETIFIKNIDTSNNPGYSEKWQTTSDSIKGGDKFTIEDI
jgi:hypothetical protein